jgi:ABC-2 type transport system ATP-binding protein
MEATIEVRGLRKSFGPTLALDGMTFTVAPGQVTGFVGPNGAGKTTTMRVILGLDAPDEGAALVGGRPYASMRRPLTRLGSLLDAAALQPGRNRAQPPAVAGALPGPGCPAGRRGARADGPGQGGAAQGGRLLAGHAAAAGHRRRAAR